VNWEALSAIGEIVGAVAVLVTLVYLAVQIRQNTAALRSAATQGAHDQVADLYRMLSTDSDLAMIFVRGCRSPDQLSDTETAKYFSLLMQVLFYVQNWHSQTRDGLMDNDLLHSWAKVLTDISKTPGFQRFWEQRQHIYSAALRRYVEDEVIAREGDASYRPLGVETR
jgi:hypothetical protein